MKKATIKITFLGTCACDFSPKLDKELKDTLDYEARRSSSVLLNDNFLIDCGTHTINSLDILKIDKAKITDLFITHLHSDHYDIDNIKMLAKNHSIPLNLWVREDADIPEILNVNVIKMKSFVRYEVKGAYITSLLANHDQDSFPQHFLIESDDKKIFYGCDGAWILNPTYYYLKDARLDMAILDCTCGDYVGDYRIAEHNTIPMIRQLLPSLKSFGIIDDNTKIYLSHLAPSLHKPHSDTVKIAQEFGAYVAYDGLIQEI